MSIPANPIRKSVPADDLIRWFESGWAYVMPDFGKPEHYIVEWLSSTTPAKPVPHRVPDPLKGSAESLG